MDCRLLIFKPMINHLMLHLNLVSKTLKKSMKTLRKLGAVLIFIISVSSNQYSVMGCDLQSRESLPVAWWNFNAENSRKVTDMVSLITDSIQGNYKLVDGVEGKALKLDGFTTVYKAFFR